MNSTNATAAAAHVQFGVPTPLRSPGCLISHYRGELVAVALGALLHSKADGRTREDDSHGPRPFTQSPFLDLPPAGPYRRVSLDGDGKGRGDHTVPHLYPGLMLTYDPEFPLSPPIKRPFAQLQRSCCDTICAGGLGDLFGMTSTSTGSSPTQATHCFGGL